MYCELCTSTKQKSALFYPGTMRMKKSVLLEHSKTQAHVRAVVGHKSTGITEEDNGLFNVFRAILFLA